MTTKLKDTCRIASVRLMPLPASKQPMWLAQVRVIAIARKKSQRRLMRIPRVELMRVLPA